MINNVTFPKHKQKTLSKEQDLGKSMEWKKDEMRKDDNKIKIMIIRFIYFFNTTLLIKAVPNQAKNVNHDMKNLRKSH